MVLLTFPILLSLAAFVGVGWGSALRIEIQPPTYAEGDSGPVNVSCTIDHQDSDGDEEFMVKIVKDGEKPLVVLRPSGIHSVSAVKPSKFLTEGLIHQKDISTSYIKLGIVDPTSQDEGNYTCSMHFIDKHHQVSDRRASANLFKLTLNDVLMMLRGQVATLEGKLEAQTSKLEEQTSKDSGQQGEIDGLREENQNQKEMMKDMAAKVSDQQRELDDLRKNQTDMLKDMAATASQTEFFVAGLTRVTRLGHRGTIVYDKVVEMYGRGYNSATGIFTASIKGLYAFHGTSMAESASTVGLSVLHNEEIVGDMYVTGHTYLQASGSYVVKMEKGDTVSVLQNWGNGNLRFFPYTIFSGYLVKGL